MEQNNKILCNDCFYNMNLGNNKCPFAFGKGKYDCKSYISAEDVLKYIETIKDKKNKEESQNDEIWVVAYDISYPENSTYYKTTKSEHCKRYPYQNEDCNFYFEDSEEQAKKKLKELLQKCIDDLRVDIYNSTEQLYKVEDIFYKI